MPWYVWLIIGLLTGGVVCYFALLIYLAKGFRR
jgi:hypothetical protein